MCLFHLVEMVLGSEDASTGETGQEQHLNIEGAAIPPAPASPPIPHQIRMLTFYAMFPEIDHETQFREIDILTQTLRIRIFFNEGELCL